MAAMTTPPNQYPRGGSRDFCNSFWGPGDDGVNILLSRMRGATKTTEEIRRFWIERAAIEEQYAARLNALSKFPLGGDEIGELLNALETLRKETEIQANSHSQLAQAIRTELETPTSHLFARQANHRKNFQAPIEKKLKAKQTQESYVTKAREKYEGDCTRIASYTQQSAFAQGKDLERIQAKLKRSQQTVQANEQDLANFTQALQDLLPSWEADWKEFCDRSQDLEEDRLDFMLNTLWSYANEVSQLCVNDDQSCERIRTALEQLEPAKELSQFVADYGTGNSISDPPRFVPYNAQDPTLTSQPPGTIRPAEYTRVSRKPTSPTYHPSQGDLRGEYNRGEPAPTTEPVPPLPPVNGHSGSPPASQHQTWPEPTSQPGSVSSHNHSSPVQPAQQQLPPSRTGSRDDGHPVPAPSSNWSQPPTAPPSVTPPPPPELYTEPPPPISRPTTPSRRRASQPLPTPQHDSRRPQDYPPMPAQPPPSHPPAGGILFYVRALFDYTATIEEEFSFQAGDIIAVTATPDDGWWSGELLDEARKEEGRHVFPSIFVELF